MLAPSPHKMRTGNGFLAGTFPDGITSVDGVPTSAEVRVLLHKPSGEVGDGIVVAVTQSSAAGEWHIGGLSTGATYDVVCRRDGFNDLIWSNVAPKTA